MPIEFKTAAQKAVYDKVAAILKEEFGKRAVPSPDAAHFWLPSGSASVQVTVGAINEKASVIRAFSWVVTGAENTPELTKFLLAENLNVRFGAFAVDNVGDICFTHAIHGESADSAALMFTVVGVASIADEYDDKIVQRFGGQRSADRQG